MNTQEQIDTYINSQPEAKRSDMQALYKMILNVKPGNKLWFFNGKNEEGKMVTNPNVGFGSYTINYADGSSREFYQVGFTGNTGGISVFIMGYVDKTFLSKTYGDKIGKASVTGYCIKFKALKDINLDVLEAAVKDRFEHKNNSN